MRILHSIHSGGFYGAEKVIFDLFRFQSRQSGCTPALLGFLDAGQNSNILGDRLGPISDQVYYLKARRGITPLALIRYGRVMESLKPHVVHSHGYKPTFYHLLSRALGLHNVPLVVTAHGYPKDSGGIKAALYRRLDLRLLAHAEAVAAVSEEMRAYLQKQNRKIKALTLENGIETDIKVNGFHPILGMTVEEIKPLPIIGSVGRLVPMKNHALLIEAVAEVRHEHPCRLIILGDGPLRPQLERLWREKLPDLKMEIVPFQADILAWIRDFDIFCLPSRDGEGLPMSLLEAGLLEKAVICSDSGGMGRLIRHGVNGLSFSMGDKQGLKRCLVEAITRPEIRTAMGKSLNLTVLENHDMRGTAAKYHSLYQSVLAGVKPGHASRA